MSRREKGRSGCRIKGWSGSRDATASLDLKSSKDEQCCCSAVRVAWLARGDKIGGMDRSKGTLVMIPLQAMPFVLSNGRGKVTTIWMCCKRRLCCCQHRSLHICALYHQHLATNPMSALHRTPGPPAEERAWTTSRSSGGVLTSIRVLLGSRPASPTPNIVLHHPPGH